MCAFVCVCICVFDCVYLCVCLIVCTCVYVHVCVSDCVYLCVWGIIQFISTLHWLIPSLSIDSNPPHSTPLHFYPPMLITVISLSPQSSVVQLCFYINFIFIILYLTARLHDFSLRFNLYLTYYFTFIFNYYFANLI